MRKLKNQNKKQKKVIGERKAKNIRMPGKLLWVPVCAVLLTGCGNKIPEMTQEEESRIITYATECIAKYSQNDGSRLIDTEKEAARRAEIAAKAAKVQAIVDANKKAQENAKRQSEIELENTDRIDVGEQQPEYEDISAMERLLGLDGFELIYDGCEVVKNYGDAQAAEWNEAIDSISADAGKNLLIIKLGIANPDSQNQELDLISKNVLYEVSVNDSPFEYIVPSMMMNDFSYIYESIEAGQRNQYILVTQVNESVEQVNQMILKVEKDDVAIQVRLQ